MASAQIKKGLGRGLSALIPDADMEFLSRVARGEAPALSVVPPVTGKAPEEAKLGSFEASATSDALAHAATKTGEDSVPNGGIPRMDNMDVTAQAHAAKTHSLSGHSPVEWLDSALIHPNPFQPRRSFSSQEMEELTASVREHGVLQPILVRPAPVSEAMSASGQISNSYQIVAGERRWRAAQAAGLKQIPAIVRPIADQQALELALIENVQRHDITPLDAAVAYRRLLQEFALSQEDVARRVGKSRPSIANTLRLLDLPNEAQTAIDDGVLSEGHGRAILLASGDGARRAVLRRVLREKLSVRATEELARQSLESEGETPTMADSKNNSSRSRKPNLERASEIVGIEEKFQIALKTRVSVKPRSKGGQILIQYFSDEDLERLITLITGR